MTLCLVLLNPSPWLWAASIQDAKRVRPFSGVSSTVRGDIRTVGMAGATTGLGDTFIAASDNPAGLAMTMNTGDFNLTSNWIRDAAIQSWDVPIQSSNFGVALSPYPWGFSFGYSTPYSEGQRYTTPAGITSQVELEIQEYRAAVARVFLENRLAIGFNFGVGRARARYTPDESMFNWENSAYALTPSAGAMFQLPNHVLLGLSYRFRAYYAGSPELLSPGLTGFFQPIVSPGRLGLGIGWIPNRFFRTDFTLYVIGSTPEAGLLADQARTVGKSVTLQPRMGAAYDFMEFKDFRATAFAGTYYEVSRIESDIHSTTANAPNRLHLTMGIETKPWILTVGTGADFAWHYRNFLVTAGLDLIKTMQKLELVPMPYESRRGGLLPRPTGLSDEGLARPLVANWNPQGPEIDPIQVGLELPERIEKRVKKAEKQLKKFFEPRPNPSPLPGPKAEPRSNTNP